MANAIANLQTRCNPYHGLIFGFLASFFFSLMSLCVKLTRFEFFLVVSIRSAIQIVLLQAPIVYHRLQIKPCFQRPQMYYAICRSLAGTSAVCCQFYAFQNMNLGDASAIIFSSPLITTMLAAIFLKEKFTMFKLAACIISFGGVILIARPPFIFGSRHGEEMNFRFAVAGIALCGALSTSVAIICIKKIGNRINSLVITYHFSIACAIVPLIILVITDYTRYLLPPCGSRRWFILMVGVLGYLGQITFTRAIQLEKASLIGIIRTTDVLFSYVAESIVFGSIPSILSIVGAILVVFASTALALQKWHHIKSEISKKSKDDPPVEVEQQRFPLETVL